MENNNNREKEKLIIIDGNSLMNRAFYALPLLETKQGFFTNAVYGFMSMLIKTIKEENPDNLVVVFDKEAPTFRHEKYPEYKSHREKTPEELRGQIPMLKELLKAMDIYFYEEEGYEADDLIGAIAKKAEEDGIEEILIISGDKDLIQLLSGPVKLLFTKKGISEFEHFDIDKTKEVYGIDVEQFVDLKALMGDKSDNIPGVPGIGEKTAKKLLIEYGNLEEVLNNTDRISAKKTAEKLEEYSQQAFLSRNLAQIYNEVDLNLDWENMEKYNLNSNKAQTLLSEWEMKSILERLAQNDYNYEDFNEVVVEDTSFDAEYIYFGSDFDYVELKEKLASDLKEAEKVSVYLYDEREAPSQKTIDPGEFGLSVAFPVYRSYFIPSSMIPELLNEVIIPYLPSNLVSHEVKKIWHLFKDEAGVRLDKADVDVMDTQICGYLLDPTQAPHSPRDLALTYLDKEIKLSREGWKGVNEWALVLLELETILLDKLKEEKQWFLYDEIELPLAFVLAKMEYKGIKVDREELNRMEKEIDYKIEELKNKVFEMAGEEFNLNSPKQLGKILFDKLKLPVIKRTKTGYSTSAQVLETLAGEHEICRVILDYRQLHKLKTTYLVGLKELISDKTGRLHTTFNQTITATGRLSSTEPNLQNIPIRLEEGRKIRKAFVASEKRYNFLACDYSQIELRILAHVSKDDNLIDAFIRNEDIHTQTASLIFDITASDVDKIMRSHAKAVNFGIAYGISDYGLSTQLNITRKQAREYIDNYFERFPGVKKYTKSIVKEARENGYVETLYKRKRKLPDIYSENFNRRTAAERTAINTPIQGTAADIIKKAMVEVEQKLKRQSSNQHSQLLLQVHDELVLEVDNDMLTDTARLIKEIMENVIELRVPLVVDLKQGKNWYDMFEFEIDDL